MTVVKRACVLVALTLSLALHGQTQNPPLANPSLHGVHGTIVIVVETKDGFVLVGDSRGTGLDGHSLPDEYQKVFSVGNSSGVVIAGVIGSPSLGGEISDSIATHLIFLDKTIAPLQNVNNFQLLASMLSEEVLEAIRGEAELFDPDQPVRSPFAEFSAVSLDRDDHPEWITVVLSPVVRIDPYGLKYVDVRTQEIKAAPISKVMALGSVDDTVNALVNADSPSPDNSYSQASIMQRYYSLKSSNQLAALSLEDGEELAQWLIKAAIDTAKPSDGVGGSVDVLAITKQGVNWIHKKSVVAKSPPIFHIRVTGSPLTGQLDGIECARCTAPPNAHLAFNGTAEARVVQPRFTGPCEFVFGSHAQKLMPETAQRLKATVGAWCDVYKAGPSGKKTKLSTATRIGQPVDPMPDYSSLADCDLKAKALDIVRQVRNLLTPYYAEERRFQTERMNRMLQGLDAAEDRDVRFFEDSLSSTDRLNDLLDQYRAQFAPNVRAMRAEISKRLHIAPGSGIKPSAAGFGSEASIWTDRLESVANQVPTSTCSR